MAGLLFPRNSLMFPRGFIKPAQPALDRNHPITRGRDLYWPLGDTTNGYSRELVAGLNFQIISGPFTLASSHHGGLASVLNGTFQGFAVTVPPGLNSLGGTWSIWIKTTNNSGYYSIFSRCKNSGSEQGIVFFMDSGTGNPRAQIRAVGSSTVCDITSSVSLSDGKWHHVALTFGTASGAPVNIYIDGISTASGTLSGSFAFGDTTFYMSGSQDTFWGYLPGSVSDVSTFNRPMSREEVRATYAEPYIGQNLFNQQFITGISTGGNVYPVSISESASAADTLNAVLTAVGAIAENPTAAETISDTAILPSTVTENASAASTQASNATLPSNDNESASAADTVSDIATLPSTITEAGAAVETVSSIGIFPRTITEVASATDTEDAPPPGGIVNIVENITAVDTVSSVLIAVGNIAENASATNTQDSTGTLPGTVAENASASDTLSAKLIGVASVAENAAITDAYISQLLAKAAILEVANAQDTLTVSLAVLTPSKCDSLMVPAITRSLMVPAIVRSLNVGCGCA